VKRALHSRHACGAGSGCSFAITLLLGRRCRLSGRCWLAVGGVKGLATTMTELLSPSADDICGVEDVNRGEIQQTPGKKGWLGVSGACSALSSRRFVWGYAPPMAVAFSPHRLKILRQVVPQTP
jgi:hypothetical protein